VLLVYSFRKLVLQYFQNGCPSILVITVRTKSRFGECYTCIGWETKTRIARILVIFQGKPMFSHIIQKVSVRAFYWCGWTSMLKKYQNTFYPRFSSIPKTGIAFPKTGFCFYCDFSCYLDTEINVFNRVLIDLVDNRQRQDHQKVRKKWRGKLSRTMQSADPPQIEFIKLLVTSSNMQILFLQTRFQRDWLIATRFSFSFWLLTGIFKALSDSYVNENGSSNPLNKNASVTLKQMSKTIF